MLSKIINDLGIENPLHKKAVMEDENQYEKTKQTKNHNVPYYKKNSIGTSEESKIPAFLILAQAINRIGTAECEKQIKSINNIRYDELRNQYFPALTTLFIRLSIAIGFIALVVSKSNIAYEHEFIHTFFPIVEEALHPVTSQKIIFTDVNSLAGAAAYFEALIFYFYTSEPSANYYYPNIPPVFHQDNETSFAQLNVKSSFNIIQGVDLDFYQNNTLISNFQLGNQADETLELNFITHFLANCTEIFDNNKVVSYSYLLKIFVENTNLGLFSIYYISFDYSKNTGFNSEKKVYLLNSENSKGLDEGNERLLYYYALFYIFILVGGQLREMYNYYHLNSSQRAAFKLIFTIVGDVGVITYCAVYINVKLQSHQHMVDYANITIGTIAEALEFYYVLQRLNLYICVFILIKLLDIIIHMVYFKVVIVLWIFTKRKHRIWIIVCLMVIMVTGWALIKGNLVGSENFFTLSYVVSLVSIFNWCMFGYKDTGWALTASDLNNNQLLYCDCWEICFFSWQLIWMFAICAENFIEISDGYEFDQKTYNEFYQTNQFDKLKNYWKFLTCQPPHKVENSEANSQIFNIMWDNYYSIEYDEKYKLPSKDKVNDILIKIRYEQIRKEEKRQDVYHGILHSKTTPPSLTTCLQVVLLIFFVILNDINRGPGIIYEVDNSLRIGFDWMKMKYNYLDAKNLAGSILIKHYTDSEILDCNFKDQYNFYNNYPMTRVATKFDFRKTNISYDTYRETHNSKTVIVSRRRSAENANVTDNVSNPLKTGYAGNITNITYYPHSPSTWKPSDQNFGYVGQDTCNDTTYTDYFNVDYGQSCLAFTTETFAAKNKLEYMDADQTGDINKYLFDRIMDVDISNISFSIMMVNIESNILTAFRVIYEQQLGGALIMGLEVESTFIDDLTNPWCHQLQFIIVIFMTVFELFSFYKIIRKKLLKPINDEMSGKFHKESQTKGGFEEWSEMKTVRRTLRCWLKHIWNFCKHALAIELLRGFYIWELFVSIYDYIWLWWVIVQLNQYFDKFDLFMQKVPNDQLSEYNSKLIFFVEQLRQIRHGYTQIILFCPIFNILPYFFKSPFFKEVKVCWIIAKERHIILFFFWQFIFMTFAVLMHVDIGKIDQNYKNMLLAFNSCFFLDNIDFIQNSDNVVFSIIYYLVCTTVLWMVFNAVAYANVNYSLAKVKNIKYRDFRLKYDSVNNRLLQKGEIDKHVNSVKKRMNSAEYILYQCGKITRCCKKMGKCCWGGKVCWDIKRKLDFNKKRKLKQLKGDYEMLHVRYHDDMLERGQMINNGVSCIELFELHTTNGGFIQNLDKSIRRVENFNSRRQVIYSTDLFGVVTKSYRFRMEDYLLIENESQKEEDDQADRSFESQKIQEKEERRKRDELEHKSEIQIRKAYNYQKNHTSTNDFITDVSQDGHTEKTTIKDSTSEKQLVLDLLQNQTYLEKNIAKAVRRPSIGKKLEIIEEKHIIEEDDNCDVVPNENEPYIIDSGLENDVKFDTKPKKQLHINLNRVISYDTAENQVNPTLITKVSAQDTNNLLDTSIGNLGVKKLNQRNKLFEQDPLMAPITSKNEVKSKVVLEQTPVINRHNPMAAMLREFGKNNDKVPWVQTFEHEVRQFSDKLEDLQLQSQNLLQYMFEIMHDTEKVSKWFDKCIESDNQLRLNYFTNTDIFFYEEILEKLKSQMMTKVAQSELEYLDPFKNLIFQISQKNDIFKDYIDVTFDPCQEESTKLNFMIYLFYKTKDESNLNYKSTKEWRQNDINLIWKSNRSLEGHLRMTPEICVMYKVINSVTMMQMIKSWWGRMKPECRHKLWASGYFKKHFCLKYVVFYAMRYTELRTSEIDSTDLFAEKKNNETPISGLNRFKFDGSSQNESLGNNKTSSIYFL